MIFPEDVDTMFEVHVPTLAEKYAAEQIFCTARKLAHVIRHHLPDCESRDVAIRKVKEAALYATTVRIP